MLTRLIFPDFAILVRNTRVCSQLPFQAKDNTRQTRHARFPADKHRARRPTTSLSHPKKHQDEHRLHKKALVLIPALLCTQNDIVQFVICERTARLSEPITRTHTSDHDAYTGAAQAFIPTGCSLRASDRPRGLALTTSDEWAWRIIHN